jgi:uncharacterized protein (DUF111 family)
MMTSGELIAQNKIAQLELRMQRLEKQVSHALKVVESLRAGHQRHGKILSEIGNVVMDTAKATKALAESVTEEKLPTLAEACFIHSLQR